MSEFEAARSFNTKLIAIVVVAIVVVAGVSFIIIGGLPGPTNGDTTTTTNTSTATTTTTTTTTTPSGPMTLTILTRHDVAIHNVFENAFLDTDYAKQRQIIDIDWKTPDASFWDDLIDMGQIDVCWGGGPTVFDQLMVDGRLTPLTSPLMQTTADRVPDELAGADMKRNNSQDQLMWMAAAISSFGFTVNHDFLDTYSLPTPSTWTELAEPIWGSRLPAIPTIGMGNAPDTTSNTRIYEIMTQSLGWDEGWVNMARMAGSSNIYGGSVETQLSVRTGEVGVAMTIDFYGYQNENLNPDCEYILPEDQTIINGDPIAIAANAPHKDAAEHFIDWVLSVPGQLLWLDSSILRMPVLEETFWDPAAADAEDLYAAFNRTTATTGIDFNDTLSLEINQAFVLYWQSVFTDAQLELVQCWTEILAKFDAGIIDEAGVDYYASLMGAPVEIQDYYTDVWEEFTLEYAQRINHDMTYDSTYASNMRVRWTTYAKAQYDTVYDLVHALT